MTAGYRKPSPGQEMAPEPLLRLLESSAPAAAGAGESLYLTPADLAALPESRDAVLRSWRPLLRAAESLPGGAALRASDTGLALLRDDGGRGLAIIPPFPITEALAGDGALPGWDAGPLRQLLAADYTVGVILLRLGRYLTAVFEGENPVVSKTDTRYVKGKHSAGGTSQLRFQRIREGQARKLYDETCRAARERFAPYADRIDYLLLGGDRLTLNAFAQVCPLARQYQAQGKLLNRRLNIREPRHSALDSVAGMLRLSRVWWVSGVGAGEVSG